MIGPVEVARALLVRGLIDRAAHGDLWVRMIVLAVEPSIVERASRIGPPGLRTLDAIHLASALELGSDLRALVTYDRRLADAAAALGLPVVSPS